MEPDNSELCSQNLAIKPNSEPHDIRLHLHIPFVYGAFWYRRPIYAWICQVAPFFEMLEKHCIHL
jgi:hypothetical protein